ncbi:acyl-CoA dehydrogenase family protein [Desulfobacca acetoxidans]|uniref:Cyclohex-1-ene-1-carbonyl-CoA dehydrogenase n=1 Tax=Desulfobacca acetoxidans (strain ATCC 700848 / DSM 11109 / ASRB2) TaxID=880072 RepID=F2NG21_DESAR|nr:acyl-CoA dehydrogenase family protein [Desulfobacca acetoxidans]AEB08434.1 Butyryl-CoA dehydrogenase [Desulfobacca acetoxidans DSM 11109]HAY21323.1 acyl-CoA dehydrogenase [Desulfobacterales bacterium]
MDYLLTEEQQMLQELALQIAHDRIKPVRAELDEHEIFPTELMRDLAQADLFGVIIPEQYGGLGLGCMENCLVLEALSTGCVGIATTFAATFLGAYPFLLYGSEDQKKRYLPPLAKGDHLAAFALTESQAGSDAGAIQTIAVRDGDSYILNGTKQWITNAGEAGIYTVIALSDRSKGARGASAFIVEADDPGISFGKKEQKMGIRASVTREIVFQNCRIPANRLIAKEGFGFVIALKTLDFSRPGVGALALGLAQAALEEAVIFARERQQFGHPIISFQAVQHMLANMATQLEAARALVYAVARAIDHDPKEFSKESAMAKLFPTDMAMQVTTDAVQILGGHGYMREYPVEKMMRDAKILQIFEGTNQILRNVIGQALNKEFSKKR